MVLTRLGRGLVIRRARKADARRIQAFYGDILREPGDPASPDNPVGIWTCDLFTRPHPTTGPRNFIIVEDTRTGHIVSALGLMPQTWAYDGVEVGVGQVGSSSPPTASNGTAGSSGNRWGSCTGGAGGAVI